jgi:hypothetical protein
MGPKSRIFVPSRLFQPILYLLVRPGGYPREDHLKGSSLVKVLTRLEKLAINKQSSSLVPFISYKKIKCCEYDSKSLYCKTLLFRNLQNNDKFCSNLVSSGVDKHTSFDTKIHSSLLRSPYITDP